MANVQDPRSTLFATTQIPADRVAPMLRKHYRFAFIYRFQAVGGAFTVADNAWHPMVNSVTTFVNGADDNLAQVLAQGLWSGHEAFGTPAGWHETDVTESASTSDFDVWFGVVAPAKTPAPIVKLLGEKIAKITAEPAFRQRLLDLGGVAPATGNTPEAFASVLQRELAVLPKAAKEAGLQLD